MNNKIIDIDIQLDRELGPEVQSFLNSHLKAISLVCPEESMHAIDVNSLRHTDIPFWCARADNIIVGCIALKPLNTEHGEIKSMRTSDANRRRGIGSKLLSHTIEYAKAIGMKRLSLETGSHHYFMPARALYRSFGFKVCKPFGQYYEDPSSVFMSLLIK